jgi:hypothetical protein
MNFPGEANKLPAVWQIFDHDVSASSNPDVVCSIDSKAFTDQIDITLKTKHDNYFSKTCSDYKKTGIYFFRGFSRE